VELLAMKPIDIKGRPIYSRVFAILQKYGDKLVELDWTESTNKPNLFYKKFQGIMVFADMRGTEVISIWEEPYPYLYDNGQREKDWKRRRTINSAVEELNRVNIPHRFSFYEECEPDGLFFGDTAGLTDGKCKICGKDFDNDGLYCSIEYEKVHLELEKKRQEDLIAEMQAQRKARKSQALNSKPKKLQEKTKKVKTTLEEQNRSTPRGQQSLSKNFDPPAKSSKKEKLAVTK
jgi:hypothetical protein